MSKHHKTLANAAKHNQELHQELVLDQERVRSVIHAVRANLEKKASFLEEQVSAVNELSAKFPASTTASAITPVPIVDRTVSIVRNEDEFAAYLRAAGFTFDALSWTVGWKGCMLVLVNGYWQKQKLEWPTIVVTEKFGDGSSPLPPHPSTFKSPEQWRKAVCKAAKTAGVENSPHSSLLAAVAASYAKKRSIAAKLDQQHKIAAKALATLEAMGQEALVPPSLPTVLAEARVAYDYVVDQVWTLSEKSLEAMDKACGRAEPLPQIVEALCHRKVEVIKEQALLAEETLVVEEVTATADEELGAAILSMLKRPL